MSKNLMGDPSGNSPGNNKKVNIDPSQLSDLECNCGNDRFKEQYIIKKMSKLQSPTGKEEIFPFQVFACTECGNIPDEFSAQMS